MIAVTLEPQPVFQVRPMQYPRSEIYFFKPLKERVPVFQKPFALRQDVLLDGTPQSQAALRGRDSVTLTGTLEYQACDDKICFNPESVPLSWTFALRPIVLERPVPAQEPRR